MHVEVSGGGPDLVLVHGWAMHGGIFAPLLPALAPHFRVHLVDLPGHGRSARTDSDIEPARCAARLLAEMPADALWVGWSYGGLVTLHAALAQPRRVRALVQIAASPRFVRGEDWAHGVEAAVFAQFGAGLRADYRGTIERFLALETLGSAQAHEELRALKGHVFERGEPALAALEDGLAVLQATDLRAQLAELAVPSVWIGGRRDRLVPAAALRWAARRCGRGDYVEIASGHAPFLSHAGEVALAIDALDARAGR